MSDNRERVKNIQRKYLPQYYYSKNTVIVINCGQCKEVCALGSHFLSSSTSLCLHSFDYLTVHSTGYVCVTRLQLQTLF